MPEYYIIALTNGDVRRVSRVLRLLRRNGIIVENIVITVRVDKHPRSMGAIGGITHNSDNVILLRGVLPLPVKKRA